MKYSELPEVLKNWIKGAVLEHEDGSISVDGDVNWWHQNLTYIPIKFRRVTGAFICSLNGMTSLENAPDWVGRDFWCHSSQLTSLDGLGEVKGEIYCGRNPVPIKDLIAGYRRKLARKELV